MTVKELAINSPEYPERLRQIDTPPEQLFTLGQDINELLEAPCVTIVGSRKVSAYGKQVTVQLANELARAGIVIISGLALGVDSLAHKSTVDAGGRTIAVLATPLNRIYPATNRDLAMQILQHGGALISEYPEGSATYPSKFIARNRIVSGLSDAVLITEATERSGTLSTARFALEQGKELLAVPGNITSPTSSGTNNLIKTGAMPVTCAADVFHALGIKQSATGNATAPRGSNASEQAILDLIFSGTSDGAQLLAHSQLEVSLYNQTLTMLEITGQIYPLGNNHWGLK